MSVAYDDLEISVLKQFCIGLLISMGNKIKRVEFSFPNTLYVPMTMSDLTTFHTGLCLQETYSDASVQQI